MSALSSHFPLICFPDFSKSRSPSKHLVNYIKVQSRGDFSFYLTICPDSHTNVLIRDCLTACVTHDTLQNSFPHLKFKTRVDHGTVFPVFEIVFLFLIFPFVRLSFSATDDLEERS